MSSSTSPLSISKRISEIAYSIEKYLPKWWKLRPPDPHYLEWDNVDHYVKLGGVIRINLDICLFKQESFEKLIINDSMS